VQVWKKYKPKKGHDASWYEIARALAKRRIPFSAAKFGDDLAKAYGVVWEDDLFAPADEDGRYTTNVDGFFGAQQEWLQNNLPERGTLLPLDEYGRPQLPKKAENVYGTPGKNDRIGHYLDPYSGTVKTIAYRLPETRKSAKGDEDPVGTTPDPTAPQPKTRPDVTQKGLAMIGDFRTDALHQALREAQIEDSTLLGLLVLALAAKNISVQSGADIGPFEREAIAATISEGGVLTSDLELVRTAARNMLAAALSCRDNMSNSGLAARIAGEASAPPFTCRRWPPTSSSPASPGRRWRRRPRPKACGRRSASATPAPGSSSGSAGRATSTRAPSSSSPRKRSPPRRRRTTSSAGPARSRLTASAAMPDQARKS
jgi:ParB family chromosome partitioning protein